MKREHPAEGRALRAALCVAAVLLSCLPAATALALPKGAEVVSGSVDFSSAAARLDVMQHSDKAIINYGDFSIAAGEGVHFYQPGSRSVVLNRVPNGPVSTIAGQLTANGRVLLINPSGIVFTEGASVSVHSLIASALDLPDADFLRDNYSFAGEITDGAVVNRGDIRAAEGGQLWLIAPRVANEGKLDAPGGSVGLVGASKAYLTDDPTGDVLVSVKGLDGEASNLGQLLSDSGHIGIYGLAVNQDGLASADSLVSNGGRIELVASGTATLGPGSITSANALADGEGGRITVLSEEATVFEGAISARGAGDGDGGFAEVSSAGRVDFDGAVDLTASNGARGTLLLDPEFLVIVGGVGDGDYDGNPYSFGSIPPSAGPGLILYDDWPTVVFESEIEAQSLLSHIILQAARAIMVNGDFAGADVLLAPDSNLTLQTRNAVIDGPGEIDLTGSYQGTGLTFQTQGTGGITINAGTDGGAPGNVHIPRLVTESGDINVTSSGFINHVPVGGGEVIIDISQSILSQSGNIRLDAGTDLFQKGDIMTGGSGTIDLSSGSVLFNSGPIASDGGAISLSAGLDLSNFGPVDSNGGDISLSAVSNLSNYGSIVSQSGAVSLFSDLGLTNLGSVLSDSGAINLSSGLDLLNWGPVSSQSGPINIESKTGSVVVTDVESGGLVSVHSAGSIDGAADPYQPDIVAPDVELVAGTGIGQSEGPLLIDAGLLSASALDGDVLIYDVGGGVEIGQVGGTSGVHAYGSGGQNIALNSNGPLVVSDDVVNHAGGPIIFYAMDFGLFPTGYGPVRPYFDSFYDVVVNGTVQSVGGAGNALIYAADRAVINGQLSCGGTAFVQALGGDIIATGVSGLSYAMLNASGSILDGGDALTDVVAPTIMLNAGTGIGLAGNHLEVDADEINAVTNVGGIYIDDVAGGLTVGTESGADGAAVLGGGAVGDIVITASSPLTTRGDVRHVGGNITLKAIGTGPGDNLQIDGNVVTTGPGAIELSGGRNVVINGNVSADVGPINIESLAGDVTVANVENEGLVSVHAAGSIGGFNDISKPDIVAPAVEMIAGGSVGASTTPMYVDAGQLAASAFGGGIYIGDVAAGVEIGHAGTSNGVHAHGTSSGQIVIASLGPLIVTDDIINHDGGPIALQVPNFLSPAAGNGPLPPFADSFFDVVVNGQVRSLGGPGNVFVYADDRLVIHGLLSSGGQVILQAPGRDLIVTGVLADGDAHLMAGGAILDGGNDLPADVIAPGIELVAGTGIGLPEDHIEIDGITLAAVTGTGGIYVDDVAGGLTVGTVGGTSGATVGGGSGEVIIADSFPKLGSESLGGLIPAALIEGADIVITTFSPLNISGDVTNLGGGRIALTASGSGAGDDLTIDGNVVATGGGSIELTGGSDVVINGDIGAEGGDILILGGDRIALNGTCTTDGGDVSIITLVFAPGPGGQISTPGGSVHVQSAGQGGLSSSEVAASMAQAGEEGDDEEDKDKEEEEASVADATPAPASPAPAQPAGT